MKIGSAGAMKHHFISDLTTKPPLPGWFGPRASVDNPAVLALIDRVGAGARWADIGGEFNLNIRLDVDPPMVLRVHRPWVGRSRLHGLRRLRERLAAEGVRIARPLPILNGDVVRVGDRWAEVEEFVPHAAHGRHRSLLARIHATAAWARVRVRCPEGLAAAHGNFRRETGRRAAPRTDPRRLQARQRGRAARWLVVQPGP